MKEDHQTCLKCEARAKRRRLLLKLNQSCLTIHTLQRFLHLLNLFTLCHKLQGVFFKPFLLCYYALHSATQHETIHTWKVEGKSPIVFLEVEVWLAFVFSQCESILRTTALHQSFGVCLHQDCMSRYGNFCRFLLTTQLMLS